MGTKPVIELRNASIYHRQDGGNVRKVDDPNNNMILANINVSIEQGELVYLIGKVGSGKSSFLKTLYGELPLITGEGTVAGFNLRKLRRKQVPFLRRRLGIVFQDYKLLHDRNVYENLRFILRATNWKRESEFTSRIEEVLEAVDLTHKMHKMPFQMSGGEQQRLAIARALLNDPDVLLADEPTGNLDPTAADTIMKIFMDIKESGCAIVMATHNINNLQQYPSRTLRFNQGSVEDIDVVNILSNK
ncbi:MAG: ATP-binding cassette domain-containing protein [Rikenellaceae bacterium]|nr:ATP-binding cassette domain-containing protein [Rikenellaceae bacterium]